MKLTKEQVSQINSKCPYDQGIFMQPNHISTNIKELVLYTRYTTGYMPGSCWDDEDTVNEYTKVDINKDNFKVLEETLAVLCPNISYLDYKKVESLIQTATETDSGYYGDYTDYEVKYIVLSDLENLVSRL